MALTLPNPEDLQAYINGLTEEEAIQQAMDLFVLATGLDATSSPTEDRIVRLAVLDMAWAIRERHEDREAEFSPFNSERIGSYSYSKAAKAITSGQSTGVPNFDMAVSYFLGKSISVDSEFVFQSYHFPQHQHSTSLPPLYVIGDDEIEMDADGNLFTEIP